MVNVLDVLCVCTRVLWFCILQLGICATTPAEFLAKAKEIVMKHQQLQSQATHLQTSVSQLEIDQQKLVSHSLADYEQY